MKKDMDESITMAATDQQEDVMHHIERPVINRMAAVLGAFGGALLGAVIWVVVGRIGFISGWIYIQRW